MSAGAPGFGGVLETCLYHDAAESEAIERFYGELLALDRVSAWPGGLAYRCGPGVLLLFERQRLAQRAGPISAHGSRGPGHACLRCEPGAYEDWRARLEQAGIEITHEQRWDERRSLYFADPAGNLIEIADGDIWPA